MEDVGPLAPGAPTGAVGGAGGELVGEEVGEDSGADEDGEGVVVNGGEAVGEAVGAVAGEALGAVDGEALGAGVGEEDEDGGDLVGAEEGAWPRAQLAMRAKRTKQAKDFAIVKFEI